MITLRCSLRLCNARNIKNVAKCYQSTKAKRAEHAERMSRYGMEFPEKLLNKKQKSAANMYIADAGIAREINNYLEPHLKESKCDTVLELNPGPCHLTRHLLDRESQFRKIILIESTEHFMPRLQEMHALYPDRVKVHHGDFSGLHKLVFMDKMDNGMRVADLLCDVPQKNFNEGSYILSYS